jgi:hypothetical protein
MTTNHKRLPTGRLHSVVLYFKKICLAATCHI